MKTEADTFSTRQNASAKLSDARRLIPLGLTTLLLLTFNYIWSYTTAPGTLDLSNSKCSPPLPTLLKDNPVESTDPRLLDAHITLDTMFTSRASEDDIDSLSVAVVTPFGTVFEHSYGALRANETSHTSSVDKHSIYRIASITKAFTVLETLILREKGAINWDDPVIKFIPNFSYPSFSWMDVLEGKNSTSSTSKQPPITIRQLASHMAGIGRDYPETDFKNWPHVESIPSLSQNPHLGTDRRTAESGHDMLNAIAETPLVVEQYSYPIYSNSGFDLLGMANLGAELLFNKSTASHNDMVKRDIFEPLGLNGSFYGKPTDTLTARIAVPRIDHEWADLEFDTRDDPAGGQYSSLADLTKVMQSFLSPSANGGLLSEYVMREWLRPIHAWSDGILEVGAPWEIMKIAPGVRLYNKGGNLPGYHSQFVLNPQFSYGIIVLVTGEYADTVTLANHAVSIFQPVFESLLKDMVVNHYSGLWRGDSSTAAISVSKEGVLYLDLLIVEDIDILDFVGNGKPAALWSTGRAGEFRIGFGRIELNDTPNAGCEPYWITIDPFRGKGAPVDLVYFINGEFVYPSAHARMKR